MKSVNIFIYFGLIPIGLLIMLPWLMTEAAPTNVPQFELSARLASGVVPAQAVLPILIDVRNASPHPIVLNGMAPAGNELVSEDSSREWCGYTWTVAVELKSDLGVIQLHTPLVVDAEIPPGKSLAVIVLFSAMEINQGTYTAGISFKRPEIEPRYGQGSWESPSDIDLSKVKISLKDITFDGKSWLLARSK